MTSWQFETTGTAEKSKENVLILMFPMKIGRVIDLSVTFNKFGKRRAFNGVGDVALRIVGRAARSMEICLNQMG